MPDEIDRRKLIDHVAGLTDTGMPKFVVEWIASLSAKQADELWVWLDGTPNCEMEMEDVIIDLFPSLNEDTVAEVNNIQIIDKIIGETNTIKITYRIEPHVPKGDIRTLFAIAQDIVIESRKDNNLI